MYLIMMYMINRFAYSSDMFQDAKRMGGPHLSAHKKHIIVALIRTEKLRTIGVSFFYTPCKSLSHSIT